MAAVFQTDKRSGITYAYEATYWWDKEKRQSRSTRKLIPQYIHEIVVFLMTIRESR